MNTIDAGSTPQPVKRQTAAARREDVIQAAIEEFATYGYYGGSTERIADAAGISQPYVLRLFRTKKALFTAALDRVCDDIIGAWDAELHRIREEKGPIVTPDEQLESLGRIYYRFVRDVLELRLVLQGSAAAEDKEIRTHLKAGMNRMFDWLRASTGASYEAVRQFWAYGMMLTIAASIHAVDDVADSELARAMLLLPEDAVSFEQTSRG